MKNISAALGTFLSQFVTGTSVPMRMAEFYTITLVGGTVITYSSADVSLTYNIPAQSVSGGTVYNPVQGMRISRGTMKMVVGTQVDQMDITLYPTSTDTILGRNIPFEVLSGQLDGAWVSIDRAFLDPAIGWTSAGIVGTVNVFAGRVSTSTIGRTAVTLTVKSPLELLNINIPRNVYLPGCMHNLFDSGCTLSASTYTQGGTVTSVPNSRVFQTNLTAGVAGYYGLGTLTFTTGANAGLTQSVKSDNGAGQFEIYYPFPLTVSSGDTFRITAGCDKQASTCLGKFGNLVNFKGFPTVPPPETAT